MTASRVSRVSVISTGSGAIHPEHMYGTRKPDLWWVFTSRRWVPVPLNVFVIEHDDGLVLFDTGADPAVATDDDYWPDRITRLFMERIFRWEIGPDDGLASRLAAAGFSADDVTTAVLSHLHFDHAGGIRDIPQAELLVAAEAWEHLHGAHPEREGVLPRDLLVADARWTVMEPEPVTDPELASFDEMYDVRGDGSMIVLPTPGHLPGSVSLLIRRRDAGPVLLIGDLTYSEELLERDQVAGTGTKELLLDSYARVRALRERIPDLVIIASHDATAADKLAAAPSPA